MTDDRIRFLFLLLAVVALVLAFGVTYATQGQESDSESNESTDEALVDESSQQLESMFEQIGVDPNSDSDESDSSWTDLFTSPFSDGNDNRDQEIDESIDTPSAHETRNDKVSESTSEVLATSDAKLNALDPDSSEPTSTEDTTTTAPPISTPSAVDQLPPPDPTPAAIRLDDLLKQVTQTPRMQQDSMHARLEDRRRLAVSLRTTLAAAQQVAAFGRAGKELLQDASLETIVSTMIEEQERTRREEEESQTSTLPTTTLNAQVQPIETTLEEVTGIAAWRPVYIVKSSRGQRVGWRNILTGDREAAYMGESLTFDDDTVTIVGVSSDGANRFIVVNINDIRHEIALF